ncbi:CHRD domain-containing protein [Usitatibacter palustris]|uniref:CHRD domain-containing protein n=1 Tax=Usitatibacter palustris TaxID=2732487 RepID=A0A6M4HAP3_9PROT|nr:CHRD domain-containing protein [Usitatibacter palustris]QJR16730.1 hypothetical protein DSM104440_03566 [Usitatibacter palustris]
MRNLLLAAALLAALPALADSNRIRTRLSGAEEVPAVATRASGTFAAQLSSDRLSIEYELSFSGLQAPVTQAHIHVAQRDVNGGIVIWLCGSSSLPGPVGTPPCPQEGTVNGLITSANVLAVGAQQVGAGGLSAVLDAMRSGLAYVNVHTTASPGGEIRGQIGEGAFAPGT